MKKRWMSLLIAAAMLCAVVLPVSASEETQEAKKNGVLIYEEAFEYDDELDHNATLAKLGWEPQTKAMGAYTDPTAVVSLQGGKLSVLGASDTYFLMLTEEDMAAYAGQTITIQYDVEYTTASNTSRYFCILANYSGQSYNSFHFRNAGNANNQAHINGSWVTYDAYNASTDASATATDNGNGTSVAMKLLGKKYNSNDSAFSGVPVTVRYILDPDAGTAVYMKKAEDPEDAFTLVSVHDSSAQGASLYGTWNANAICVKIGGQQNGTIDNIAVWTGNGNYPQPEPEPEETTPEETEAATSSGDEEPKDNEAVEEEPKKVKEPQTIVNKMAVWAIALFGGWIILKKGKDSADSK